MSKPTETAIIESVLTAIEGILTLPIRDSGQTVAILEVGQSERAVDTALADRYGVKLRTAVRHVTTHTTQAGGYGDAQYVTASVFGEPFQDRPRFTVGCQVPGDRFGG